MSVIPTILFLLVFVSFFLPSFPSFSLSFSLSLWLVPSPHSCSCQFCCSGKPSLGQTREPRLIDPQTQVEHLASIHPWFPPHPHNPFQKNTHGSPMFTEGKLWKFLEKDYKNSINFTSSIPPSFHPVRSRCVPRPSPILTLSATSL